VSSLRVSLGACESNEPICWTALVPVIRATMLNVTVSPTLRLGMVLGSATPA
jgi:hypothetical protein